MKTAVRKIVIGIMGMMMLAGCARDNAEAVLLEATPALTETAEATPTEQPPIEVICKCECNCQKDGQTAKETLQGEVSSAQEDGKVNINTADEAQLQTLSGIGQTRAQAIISYRQTHGAFQSIEDIQNVNGIKSGVYDKIKDDISVG
ncbi:MAG: ComEA family DNA-binding protein [Clostridiales bacterium]|nr:ComEA family DNA-binding protein [Lachnospiraceae bacterium]MDD6617716.1 ComEA family DNA-binding protein [Clostridiales bacterium]